MYNINTISFLVSSLNDTITIVGRNNKGANVYKQQVRNLINSGYINQQDADLIFELVNLSYINDDEKWQVEADKLNYFIQSMDVILSNNQDKRTIENIIYYMEREANTLGKKKVIKAIKNIFEIKDMPSPVELKGNSNFGTHNFNTTIITEETFNKLRSIFGTDLTNITIEFRNVDAVCSGDIIYHRISANKIFNPECQSKETKFYLDKIIKAFDKDSINIRVGIMEEQGDACRPCKVLIQNKAATKVVRDFIREYKGLHK